MDIWLTRKQRLLSESTTPGTSGSDGARRRE
jgi:hypothetical protein